MVLKMNTDGVASLPTLTDTPNVLREANIAGFTITTGGVINITVGRVFCRPGIVMPKPDVLEWDGLNQLTIADEGVTAAMAGAGVPVLTNRQGGSATNWATAGTTNYSTSAINILMQSGVVSGTVDSGASIEILPNITFPVAFSQPPVVVATISSEFTSVSFVVNQINTVTSSLVQFIIATSDGANVGSDTDFTVNWIAIGQRA
jgi:hypothetical protein